MERAKEHPYHSHRIWGMVVEEEDRAVADAAAEGRTDATRRYVWTPRVRILSYRCREPNRSGIEIRAVTEHIWSRATRSPTRDPGGLRKDRNGTRGENRGTLVALSMLITRGCDRTKGSLRRTESGPSHTFLKRSGARAGMHLRGISQSQYTKAREEKEWDMGESR